jgi:hypothetical protein
MSFRSTISDVIRLSHDYEKFEAGSEEVSLDDLALVMGGSLGGLAREIGKATGIGDAVDTATNILKEVPGAIDDLGELQREYFPTDAQVNESMHTAQESAAAAKNASDALDYASYMNQHGAEYQQEQLSHGYY